MRVGGRAWLPVACLAVGGALVAAGCGTTYVARAAYEEACLLWRRQPIDTLLAGDVDADTRAKLELALAVRRYAADDLGLDVGGSYESVAPVDAGQVVHVVSAAPRDRLVPYTWWFPIVGRVPYRAYFAQADADALATELERQGYDTYVRPAVAFSTLGWFDDPLLSTLLRYDQTRLAETIIHELLHNTIYLPGQTAFNESFAEFVGQRGAQAFFLQQGDARRAELAGARWVDAVTYSGFLGALVAELEQAYAAGVTADARAALFAEARRRFAQRHWRTDEYAAFERQPLNNAVVLHDRLYADRLELFAALDAGCDNDLRATVARIRQLVDGRDDPFAALQAAAGSPADCAAVRAGLRARSRRAA